ncbi:MAG: DUF3300 domain-containing protein [Terrimicrobiaceae bacterium]
MKTLSLLQSGNVNRGWKISFLILFGVFVAAAADGQSPPPEEARPPEQDVRQRLSPEELDRLLAPIALYPDALIALILPASTVPSDLVLAARYLGSNGDPAQIANQPWDDSVKSLARYPDVLKWMDQNLDWTTTVGDAFIDQPADVMNSVQRLRTEALAAGNLFDTPQQTIIKEETSIRIVPAEPDVIYVPEYDPEVVYVQPYSQDLGPVLTFGAGFAVGSWLTYDLDWNRRGIYVGHWRPGWKRDRDWDRGDRDWDRGDRDRDWDRDRDRQWDRGDRGPDNINVVNINSDTARQWQPSGSSQRRQAQEQRVRRANARFSNVETTDVNRAPAGASTTGLPEDSRINQIPRPSRLESVRQGRERERRNAREDRNGRSNDLPASSIPPSDAAQGSDQKPPESAGSPNVAGEQGAPTPGGGRDKDSRDLNKRDRGNRQGANAGQANVSSEARGKDRKLPETTVAPNVAGELGTPREVGEQGNPARNVNKQGRDSRQRTSTGMPDATAEPKDKSRKAPQPSAAPNVASEQGMPPAAEPESAARDANEQGRGRRKGNDAGGANVTSGAPGRDRKPLQPTVPPNVAGEQKMPASAGDQEGTVRNVNKQEKSGRQEPAAVDGSRDRGRAKGDYGQGSGSRESKKNEPPSGSQPAAVDTGAPKQKEQKQAEQRQSAPPQPGNSQQRPNERKREQKSPSPPAAPAPKQDKPPQQQSAQPQRDQQPKRSAAAPAQKNEPAQPANAPQGKGGGKKDDKKDKGDN